MPRVIPYAVTLKCAGCDQSPRPLAPFVAVLLGKHQQGANMQNWDITVDCEGMLCPLPVLRARKLLIAMPPGQILRLTATDAMAAIDLPHFCTEAGHHLISADTVGLVTTYLIRRGTLAK